MLCNRALQSSSLASNLIRKFSLNFKRKPTPRDLEKYDLITVGGNLGGILTQHIDKVTHGHLKMFCAFDNPINQQYPMRVIYEQQRCLKQEFFPSSKLSINMYTAHSEYMGVKDFLPNENKIVMRNGRVIQYDHLVIANGLQHDIESVKGLDDAWADLEHPVFMCKDHASWKSKDHKYCRFIYSFTGGDAIFCIPPYPFSGEVGGYNFFVANEIWKWYTAHG